MLNQFAVTILNAADEDNAWKKALRMPATNPKGRIGSSGLSNFISTPGPGQAAVMSHMRENTAKETAALPFLRALNNNHALLLELSGPTGDPLKDLYTRSVLYDKLNTSQQSLPAANVSGLQNLIAFRVNRAIPTWDATKQTFTHFHLVLMRPWTAPGVLGCHSNYRDISDDLRNLVHFLENLMGEQSAYIWPALFENFLRKFDDTDVYQSIRFLPLDRLLLVTYAWVETLFNAFIRPDFGSLPMDSFIKRTKDLLVVDVKLHRDQVAIASSVVFQSQPIQTQGLSSAIIGLAASAGLTMASVPTLGAVGIAPDGGGKRKKAKLAKLAVLPSKKAKIAAASAAATATAVPAPGPGAMVVFQLPLKIGQMPTAGNTVCLSNLSFLLALQAGDCKNGAACTRLHSGPIPNPISHAARAVLLSHTMAAKGDWKSNLGAAIAALP